MGVRSGMAIHLHHVDRIGMGNDRETVNDSEYRKMMLCAEKHNECHAMGQNLFNAK
jgi:hypothetical protein